LRRAGREAGEVIRSAGGAEDDECWGATPNRIQSSRRLEQETQRNLELMWLTGRLMPGFKTIANSCKDNGTAIRRVCRQFIVLCRQLDLFTQALVAIDGSKFKAVNNRDKNFTPAKMKRRMEQINESIERYLRAMDTADRAEPEWRR
jgi:transposase